MPLSSPFPVSVQTLDPPLTMLGNTELSKGQTGRRITR